AGRRRSPFGSGRVGFRVFLPLPVGLRQCDPDAPVVGSKFGCVFEAGRRGIEIVALQGQQTRLVRFLEGSRRGQQQEHREYHGSYFTVWTAWTSPAGLPAAVKWAQP